MNRPRVVLTNDDGIDSPALAALYEELSQVAEVTAVAPADDQSGVGRARSGMGGRPAAVSVEEHDLGYAVGGTPADCVAAALRGIEETADVDVVVSGCNVGPNCGGYIMGHSGTVGAAVEAGYLGVPALAVSGYHGDEFFPPTDADFGLAAEATRFLLERALAEDAFEELDFLNVNAPVEPDGDVRMRVTRPLHDYDTAFEAAQEDGGRYFRTTYWASGELDEDGLPNLADFRGSYPSWSDRAAVVDGDVSVSPLRVPQVEVESEVVESFAAAYNGAAAPKASDD